MTKQAWVGAMMAAAVGVGVMLGDVGEAHALQCGQRLVVEGDRIHYVRSVCGEPASVVTRTETRTTYSGGVAPNGRFAGQASSVTVSIEVWVYDFGPNRFMEELTFENGVLVASRPIGPGTRRAH